LDVLYVHKTFTSLDATHTPKWKIIAYFFEPIVCQIQILPQPKELVWEEKNGQYF